MTLLSYDDICAWLREDDPDRLASLWQQADTVRRETVGDAVHLRGLLEISNNCCRMCTYCGLRAGNRELRRYRMSDGEIMSSVFHAVTAGYGTVVLQAGEDYGIKDRWLANIVHRIKLETPLAVTLSMGERPLKDLVLWRDAGADRYLLRFETSDPVLYPLIHPTALGRYRHRVDVVRQLKQIGYETGSGIMIGLPGQSYESLASDIRLFEALDLDMVGVGPYIPHPDTPMGRSEFKNLPVDEQVPNTELMTYKVIALTRIVCPEANIPATTALATVNRTEGIKTGLRRGANIVMPNLTPMQYRSLYEIYPEKGCIEGPSSSSGVKDPRSLNSLYQRLHDIGRTVGDGQGKRRRGLTGRG